MKHHLILQLTKTEKVKKKRDSQNPAFLNSGQFAKQINGIKTNPQARGSGEIQAC